MEEVSYMKRKDKNKNKKPPVYTYEQIKKMEQEEQEKKFWRAIMNDTLGGKKNHGGN